MEFLRVAILALAVPVAHADRSEIEVKPHTFVDIANSKQASNSSLEGKLVAAQKDREKTSDAPDLMEVFEHNQRTRNSIKSWVTTHDLKAAIGNYGLGPPVESLAKDTGKDPIQHDFVSQLGARLEANGQKVRYLEIGVSVLKSVHTQSNFFRNAIITSFDIEDPNPTIEGLWKDKSVVDQWDADAYRAQNKREHDYINKYQGPNSNTLYYVAGDAYSGVTYDHLRDTVVSKHGPMNLVLSDAYHSASSVSFEVNDLLSHGIIVPGQGVTIVWDDCDDSWDGIYSAMTKIFRRLRSEFEGQATCSGRFRIPGWVGKNEGSHGTCVFSTMDLSGPHLQASHSWVAMDSDVTCHSGEIGWIERISLIFDYCLESLGWFPFLGFMCHGGWLPLISIFCFVGMAFLGLARAWLKSDK